LFKFSEFTDLKMLEEYPDVMTPEQVANVLQLSIDELTELLNSNELPAKRLGRFWRISKQNLINFLNPQTDLEIHKRTTSAQPIIKKLDTPNKSDSQEQFIASPLIENVIFETKQEINKPDSPISNPEVLKKLYEIDARFKAQTQTTKIELVAPEFTTFPKRSFTGSHALEAKNIFDRIKNQYDNAIRINELHPKFQRIQPILFQAENLSKLYPQSSVVKFYLGYFSYLIEKYEDSYIYYRDAAFLSNQSEHWYNFAVASLKISREHSCHALCQFFGSEDVSLSDAWYLYIGLTNELCGEHDFYNLFEKINSSLSDNELEIVFDSSIYLLSSVENLGLAEAYIQRLFDHEDIAEIVYDILRYLKEHHASSSYLNSINKLEDAKQDLYFHEVKTFDDKINHKEKQQTGYIHTYKPDKLFGFLRGSDGLDYFFHRSAIDDDVLYDKLDYLKLEGQVSVIFNAIKGPKGWLAINISMSNRSPDDIFNSAVKYAEDGDYPKAISLIKKLIDVQATYPKAQQYYDQWREYVLISGLPKGNNPYDRAKRAQLAEKNLKKAADLFLEAIEQDDKTESAIKDLAALYDQQSQTKKSVELLLKYKNKISNQQSVDNMLINLYFKIAEYDQAISLLRHKLLRDDSQKINVLLQIGSAYLRQGSYDKAKNEFNSVINSQPSNIPAQRNIAICLFKLEQYDEAKKQLQRILAKADDVHSSQLLEEISLARKTGDSASIDRIIIETTFSATSTELTKFAKFFLERCDFQGVSSQSIQAKEFTRMDIRKIEDLASQLGTRRPRDRAAYYLSAAKITQLLDEEHTSQFYKYLCRSFASRGDAAVLENKPLDAIQDLYCEALSVYDGDKNGNRDEQDAVNALVRFLFSTLGTTRVPLDVKIPSIDEAIETVISSHPQKDKLFGAIAYLSMRSLYAANKILNRLYNKHTIQALSLEFLRARGISDTPKNASDFMKLWNKLKSKHISDSNSISDELRLLMNFNWKTAWLEDNLKHLTDISNSVFFSLDKERILVIHKIFEMAIDFCKQSVFEEQELLCLQMEGRCQDLLDEINNAPTKFSVENLHDLIASVKNKVNSRKQELYETSSPQLSLKLALEQYAPDNNSFIEVQIAINNKIGCSPAENIQLVVQEEESLFKLRESEIKVDTSLRGGTQVIVKLPLRVLEDANKAKAFSLPIYVQYRTRTEETVTTPISNFSIKLYSEQDFEIIDNPYAAYAEGGEVGEPDMFYGRSELIENIAKSLISSKTQSKCVVIFGQKRSGKSSVLYHLEKHLQKSDNITPINIGNISTALEQADLVLPMFLWTILNKLKDAIEDRIEKGFSDIPFELPDSRMFCEHPNPLIYFKEIFSKYKRTLSKADDWKNLQHVVLIDEFSYIYDEIVSKKRVPNTFMRHWKALLQDNYFSAVLVGQDVMPKFKQLFPNEFGTTQDERVTYLRREDAEQLVDEPIRINGIDGEPRYREKAIARIIELTASSPFYIQILCSRLVDYMNRKRAIYVTEADVEQVKDELIIGVNALSRDKFENLINSGDTSEDAIPDEDIENVLREIALNSKTNPCNSAHINCQITSPLDMVLDDLVKRDVLDRERTNYYSIKVGLFKEWLISHA